MTGRTPSLEPVEYALQRRLAEILPGQRWFGGKARRIATVGVDDLTWLPRDEGRRALALATVRYGDASEERYTVVAGLVRDPRDSSADGGATRPVSVIEDSAQAGASLVACLAAGDSRPTVRGGSITPADVTDEARRVIEQAQVKPLTGEQSNTSYRVAGRFVFKLFRKLAEGEHPECEIGRFFARYTRFRATPSLHGSLSYAGPNGRETTIGVLQDWVENQGDGWRHFVGLIEEEAREGTAAARIAADARSLGETTADFHAALASREDVPAFAPVAVDPADAARWRDALAGAMARVSALIGARASWPQEARALGDELAAAWPDTMPPPPVTEGPGAFRAIRVHGDYHLGQTLRAGDGFVVIDFEGEPALPLAERRRKTSALKDVAGMLRSFDYLLDSGAANLARARAAIAQARRAFLDGYLDRARQGAAVFLPGEPAALAAGLRFFELQKALYEVEYEANNRPAWLAIPLRGVRDLLLGRA